MSEIPSVAPTPPSAAARLRGRITLRPAVATMVVLTLFASALNYGSSLIFSRVLSPASFGDLNALLALAIVIAVPTGAAQTVVAARVARLEAAGADDKVRYIIRHALAHVVVIATVATLIYIALIPVVDRTLDLQVVSPAIALTPLVFLAFLVPVVLGVLQGLDRFVAFGVMSLALAISRPVFGVPWAQNGGGAGGAIAGQAVGSLVVLLVGMWFLRDFWRHRGFEAARTGLKRKPDIAMVVASGSFIAFAVISNFDTVLAKAFLAPDDAGVYAALATIGKILIFLPGAIAVALVPNAARAAGNLAERQRALRIAAAAVLGTTILVALPMALAPGFTLEMMFGEQYRSAESGVLPMCFAGTGLALLYLLVVYSVTIEDRRWVFLVIAGVAVQVAGISLFHDSPQQVAAVQAVVIALVLLVNEAKFISLLRPHRA